MRRAARTDQNHAEVVKQLRQIGCLVLSLAAVGKGCPDLLVSRQGHMFLLEIKDGKKPPSARKLTPDEAKFALLWGEHVTTVNSPEEAVKVALGR